MILILVLVGSVVNKTVYRISGPDQPSPRPGMREEADSKIEKSNAYGYRQLFHAKPPIELS